MNALLEEGVIRALYSASQAGVTIDLIVRGACALRPGHRGSIREHPRALDRRPLPGAQPHLVLRERRRQEVWLSSADWMGRNLFRRVEVAFPVLDPGAQGRVIAEGLNPYLADNRDAWVLAGDGTYSRPKRRTAVTASRAHRTSCSIASPSRLNRNLAGVDTQWT